jgi:membrane protein implicated in regulation of membrane protease activity
MLVFGVILLLAGVIAEAIYITTSGVAYGNTLASDSYMVTGILFIIVGFILTLSSVKIPNVRVP